MKRLLLVGGGHSHVEVLRQFGLFPDPTIEVTLVSPHQHTPYSGMLPGWIAGHYQFVDCHIELARVARFARARFVQGRVASMDRAGQRAILDDGAVIGYDVCSIDIGSTPPISAIAGAEQHAVAVKPVGRFIESIEHLAAQARGGGSFRVAVIGAGAAGVEVLLAVQYRLAREAPGAKLSYAVVTATATVLPSHPENVRKIFARILGERNIAVHTDFAVRIVSARALESLDGRTTDADFVVIASGADPASWPARSGIVTDSLGFIKVTDTLQSVGDARLFAAGDIASGAVHTYPKSGVYAVRQGPVLAANLRNALTNRPLARYIPQRVALALISTGKRHAVATRGNWAFEGGWVWRWKDAIDRKFMNKYNRLPVS